MLAFVRAYMRACTRANEAQADPQSTRWHPNGSREASSPCPTLMMTEVDVPILENHRAEGENSSSAIDLIPLHLGAIAVEDATCHQPVPQFLVFRGNDRAGRQTPPPVQPV